MTKTRIRWLNAIRHRGPGYDLPTQSETDLRTTLTSLIERWEQMAAQGEAAVGHFEGPAAATLDAEVTERSATYRKAATDVRDVLANGLIPHDLLTSAELKRHGGSKGATR